MNVNSASSLAADSPQKIRTTSAKGAFDSASSEPGIKRITVVDAATYTNAATNVPSNVARGIVRCGSMTCSAGTVADSSPSSAHKVSVAEAVTAESVKGCASTLITAAFCSPNSTHARTMTASSGSNFNAVVTI